MEKHHYDFELNLGHSSNVHRIELSMIPKGSFILDVGCHTGIMGEILRQKKEAKVVGVDMDSEALRVARGRLQSVFLLDIEQEGWSRHLINEGFEKFDTVLFGDVLEHTHNPERILREAKTLLKSEGRVIVSVPNIAHWKVRLALLFGRFEYQESGILDKTHLRFFTKKTAKQLLENSGYAIRQFNVAGYALPHWLLRLFPGLFTVQFVMCAVIR